MAQRFDARRQMLLGDAVPIVENIGSRGGPRQYSASMTGVLLYRVGAATLLGTTTRLVWFDRQGKELESLGEPGSYNTVTLSPDGTHAAITTTPGGAVAAVSDIWIHDLTRGTKDRLTSGRNYDWLPTWSPDGSRVIFSSDRDGTFHNLYRKAASGAGNDELLFKSDEHKSALDWSRDGRFLLYSVTVSGLPNSRDGIHDLWYLPLTGGDSKPQPYLKSEFNESQGRFSPDGRYVAYRSDASGRDEIYVQPFPAASAGKWTVSRGGGFAPRWREDGKELYYISPDRKMMAVEVSTKPEFRAGIPKVLFQTTVLGIGSVPARHTTRYDVTADGKKFLINCALPPGAAPQQPIIVILNWPALLKSPRP